MEYKLNVFNAATVMYVKYVKYFEILLIRATVHPLQRREFEHPNLNNLR